MLGYAIAAGAAAVMGLIAGGLAGAGLSHRKFSRHYEEIRSEVARMRRVAEERLDGDDPDLNTLLKSLNDAVGQTYKAVEGLENEGRIIRVKSEAAREIIASSRQITRMIDAFAGDAPEPAPPPAARVTPKTNGSAVETPPPARALTASPAEAETAPAAE